jgi:hypothetical protein
MIGFGKWFKVTGLGGGLALAAVLAVGVVLAPRVASAHGGMGGFGGPRMMGRGHGEIGGAALATALGITTEKMDAAEQAAAKAILAQAVKDGKLTQAQADQLGTWQLRGAMHLADRAAADAALAKALGISTTALQAGRDKAFETTLAQAVTDGRLTQAQADMVRSRYKLQSYLSTQGLEAKLRAVHDQALKDAVAAGVITQEQADQLQAGEGPGLRGFGPMRGGLFGRGLQRGLVPVQPNGGTPVQPRGIVPLQPSGDSL